MSKRILYGNANYEEISLKNGYFVDKTPYIEKLELIDNPVFLRPRRFGKSLWCRMLECYYNIRQKEQFESLFGQTYIGQNPTPLRNSYFVLPLDFSTVELGADIAKIEASFNHICNLELESLVIRNKKWFQDNVQIDRQQTITTNLKTVLQYVTNHELPSLYVIIDEYDNFANQLITQRQEHLYRELTADTGFLKSFFKTLKEGRKTGAIANIFITGVLPITIDDLASGFNIANFITLVPEFEAMLGFTQLEVNHLLDEIYNDYQLEPTTRREVETIIKNQYNGYHFINPQGEALYNATILMYFLQHLCLYRTIPDYLTDLNLKTDLSWVKRITSATPTSTHEFVDHLLTHNSIGYSQENLTSKFNMSTFFDKEFFPISFYYLGMLTKQSDFALTLPNMNMRTIFVSYFNELHKIDVSTQYMEMMQHFIDQPDLPRLFADYWRLYVSQLPETIFQQVNENFYRTTFYALCNAFLSKWFTWNVERSYPQGKSDLEFVGKYNERFAGLRYVIEFKYYSNAELRRLKKSVKSFTLQPEDTAQIAGYVQGLQTEYPHAHITQFIIYCFGNQGFRVFEI